MPQSTRLSNGVRILTETIPQVRSVSLGVWVKTGSRHDPAKKTGIAHFIEHMLFKGTTTRSALQIAKEIDALGGIMNASTGKEYTVYYIKVLDEHLQKASEVLFDIFLNSELDPLEIEKEKKVVLQEIHMVEDSPEDLISEMFADAIFEDTSLGKPILGDADSIGSILRNDMMDHINSCYDADSIIVAGAGNLEHEGLLGIAGNKFETVKSMTRSTSPVIKPRGLNHKAYERDLEQIHFTLGVRGPSMREEKRWVYSVLNSILGGSMSSMLFQEIREKLGLVYSIYSYLNIYEDCGVLAVNAATTSENMVKTLEVLSEQMRKLKKGDFGGIKLDEVKAQMRGHILLSQEITEHRMSSIAKNEMFFQREIPVEEIIEKINAVSEEELIELAGNIFTEENLTLVTLGRDVEEQQKLPSVLQL
ncbi:MAG TPA: pitrilysin family protein [Desulfomonilia bacterium]